VLPIDLEPGRTVYVQPPNLTQIVVPLTVPEVTVLPVAGPTGPRGPAGDSTSLGFLWTQMAPSDIWTIVHNLGYHPAGILVKDQVGNIVEFDDVMYVDTDNLLLYFPGHPFSGTAELS
jgi:hypothetical protein